MRLKSMLYAQAKGASYTVLPEVLRLLTTSSKAKTTIATVPIIAKATVGTLDANCGSLVGEVWLLDDAIGETTGMGYGLGSR